MSDAEEIMLEIYNTLVQIRYPKVTTAEAKNVELTILHGENRIFLLTWLLTEKSSLIATKLQKLKGVPLEAELVKYYSKIGICSKREILLGNCTLEEQLPTLKLLLDFIKNVYVETSTTSIENESIDNILQVINNKLSNTQLNIEPRLNYSESIQYFDKVKKHLEENLEIQYTNELEKERETTEEYLKQVNEEECNETDRDAMFNTEIKSFIESFSMIGSWPKCTMKNESNTILSMDNDIKDIYSNFSSLTKFLQARDEILEASIPKGLNKTNTQLSKIVEDIVISTEETLNMFRNHE